jgi:hypothetical protein
LVLRDSITDPNVRYENRQRSMLAVRKGTVWSVSSK